MDVKNDDDVLLDRSMRPDLAEVAATRRAIADAVAAAGGDPDLTEDVELVASELLTNAVEQSPVVPVRAVLNRCGTTVSLTVANHRGRSSSPAPILPRRDDDPVRERGRGLSIVEALSDRVAVDDDHGWTTITCWWRIPGL